MKTKISRFSKSVLSVILAMTLIMSTMLIGTITVNAEITGLSALYFTPDSSNWADASATFKLEYTTSGGTNTRVPFELIDSENSVYKATLDSSTTYTKFKFWRYSSDGNSEWNSSGEFNTIPTGMNYFTKTSNWWNTWDPVNGNKGTYHGTWSTYGSGSGETISDDLLSVLKKEKVMFYYGHLWSESNVYLRTSSNTSDNYDSGTANLIKITKGTTEYTFKSRSVAAPSSKYYISNNGTWSGVQMSDVAVAGIAYVLNSNNNFSGSSTNNVYPFSAGTTTVTTTASDSINVGEKLSVSTSDAGTSVVGKTNYVQYYITKSSESNYTKYELTDGTLDTSALEADTYTLKTVLYDGSIYVVGATNEFTVKSSSTHNVTVGTHENGDVQLVSTLPAAEGNPFTFKVKANEGYEINTVSLSTETDVTAGTTDGEGYKHYTFTMPATDVTINATFKAIKYYYSSNYDGSNHFVEMQPDSKNPGSYVVHVKYDNDYKNKTDVGYLNKDKKFKIANVGNNDDGQLDKSDNCVNYNITESNVEGSTRLSGVTFYFDDTYKDLYIQGTSLTDFYIQYTPGGAKGLAGKIKVWSVEDYNGTVDPKTYTIKKGNVDAAKGDFDVTVGGTSATSAVKDATVTVAPTPTDGYVVDKVTYTPEGGTETEVTLTDSAYKFNMPAKNVTVNVTFKEVATTKTYDVVKGESQDSISMTETAPGSGIFVSSDVINNGDYFTIRKTIGSEKTYAANNNYYYFVDSSNKATVSSWSTTYSDNTNIYINNLNSAQYVYYDSKNDQIYLQSTGSGGGTLSDPYFLISNLDNPSNWTESMFHQAKKDSDGKYYITITPAEIAELADAYNSNVYFTMASAKSVDKIYFQDSNSPHATTTDESLISVEDKVNSGKKFCRFSIKSDSVISVTISYDNNNTFSVIPESSKIDSSVEVIAKDATLRAVGDYYSTLHEYGNTYFYTENSDGNKKYYKSGTDTIPNKMSFTRESQKSVAAVSLDEVKKGTTLHIETQNVKDGYYVAGYVVNGETLALFNKDDTPVLDYTIPYDTEATTKIEITPVYFAKNSSNCVTFYVEGFDSTVQKTWGNTIACYPYYSGASSQDNAFSSYPGQPMLYKDGKYFIQVPRTFGGNKVVGMTLNNYKWDDVHGSINTLANAQTYDYDDFVRIADKMEGGEYIVDNIIFSFKFRTKNNNFGYKTPESITSPDTITFYDFAAGTGNGWENLTDHNGNLVNIFGKQLVKTNEDQYSKKSTIEDNPTNNQHLLIVSNGYDENYQGYYATEWTIYAYKEGAYKKVAQIPSSALVLSYDDVAKSEEVSKDGAYTYRSQLSSYKLAYAALNTDEYKNLPAYITYEQNDKQSNSNDGSGTNEGYRCDGRWYYSKNNEDISSNVKIQYADDLSGTFTDDPFVTDDDNVGTTTQAKAYFTNTNAYGKTTCKGNIGQGNFDITTTYNDSKYMFVGWYLEKEGVTTKITNSTNASIEMTGSETYVARYVKIPTGSINISHSLFSSVSQTAAKGAGTLGLQVTLSYNDGTNEFNQPYAYNTSDSSVSTNVLLSDVQAFYAMVTANVASPALSNFSLKVSLSNSPAQHTTLNDVYLDDYSTVVANDYLSFTKNNTSIQNLNWTVPSDLTSTNEAVIKFDKLFNDSTSFEKPVSTSIKFFSEFKTDRVNYEITYNFKTRLYGEKQYKKSGSISVGTDGLISDNGTYSFTNAYIMSVAPDESNFMKEFNWDEASIIQNYYSETHTIKVTVKSKQVDRTVRATIHLPDGLEAKDIPTTYGGHFTDKYGKFVMAPANNNAGQEFSYWEIKTLEGAFVANCYSQYFNYVGYDDYIVTAVYGEGKNTEIYDDSKTSTTVTFLEYSRNHWNDYDSKNHPHLGGPLYGKTGTEYDRLYADFALAFNYKGILLNKTDVPGLKLGYVLDVTGESAPEALKQGIMNNSGNSSFKINDNNVLNYSIDRTDLDNKNRVECYYGIKNTPANRDYQIKVYSYMIVDGEVTLSEPIPICYSGAINE